MEEYTPEKVESYIQEVKDICAKYKSYGMIFKKKSYLKDFVEWKTSTHLSDPFYTFRTKLYWIVHDLTDFPRCKECGKPLEHKNIDSVSRGYCDYCSNACAQSSKEVLEKRKTNYRQLHGVDCWQQLPEARERLRQIWKNKTQEEIDERTRKTKATLKERHGDENYNNIELTQKHDRMNHGGKLACQTKEGKAKRKATCRSKWNVDYPSQRPEFKDMVNETWSKKTEEEIRQTVESRERTCLEKIGVKNPMQSKDILDRALKTQIDKYNGIGFASKEINEKIQCAFQQTYGTSDPGNRPEAIEARRLKWESRTDEEKQEFVKKCQETNRMNHGGLLYQQTHACHARRRKKYMHDGMWFDSKWEIKVYDYCKNNNLLCEYQPNISFTYECCGRKWIYQPDFLINGKIYEVKGDQFFRMNESTGKEEMFCPYRNKKWSNERYDRECVKFEAKHQCMLRNNVTILRGKDVNNLKEVFNHGNTK